MFKKRESIEILDIPELHRKKLIKLPEVQKEESTKITNDGFFDLSQITPQNNNISEVTQKNEEIKTQETNQLTNFLTDFASIGTSNPTQNVQKETKTEDSSEVKDLKWRIENLEFKLEQLIEKVNSINE
ncbi:MAG: hypothetical protein AABX23_01525 [Nanoarchaeota archaeon]